MSSNQTATQITADAVGVAMNQVRIVTGDTQANCEGGTANRSNAYISMAGATEVDCA